MDIRIPSLAEGVESATVVGILVKEGQEVKAGQTLLELETAKAVGSIPSPAAGRIQRILVQEGQDVRIGQVVATLEAAGAASEAPAPAAPTGPAPRAPSERSASDAPPRSAENANSHQQRKRLEEPQGQGQELKSAGTSSGGALPAGIPAAASPSLRRTLRDLGIDPSVLRGTGRGGRIEWNDVRSYIQDLQTRAQAPAATGSAATPSAATAPVIDFAKWGPVRREKASRLRRTIAEHMTASWTTIPHVTQFVEADITGVMQKRKRFAPAFEKKGVRLTLTALLFKVLAKTLKTHPLLNASYDAAAGEIVFKDYVHLGLAVDSPAGLVVPVLRDAGTKDLMSVSRGIQDLAERARNRSLSLEEMQGGSFTVSNQGAVGGTFFTPIINAPESAILGVGQALLKPVVDGKTVRPRLLLPLSLSHDHRIIDGAAAARFLTDLVKALAEVSDRDFGKTGDRS